MRQFVLGGLLVLTSAAAIAYVYANPTSTPCCLSESTPIATGSDDSLSGSPCCEKCKSGVVDVVDLNTAYSANAASNSTISFDEPPLAKPNLTKFIPVQFEDPNSELAPAPRLVK